MSTCVLNQELRGLGGCRHVSIPFLSPQLLRRKQSKTCEKMHSGITRGWWFWLNQSDEFTVFFIWAAVVVFLAKEKKSQVHAHLEVLGRVKVLNGFSSGLDSLRGGNIVITWEFRSGTTPGPAEVAGPRAASGSSVLKTVRGPKGGGDQEVFSAPLPFILLKCSHSPSVLSLFGIWFCCVCAVTVGRLCLGEEMPPEVHTQNQRMNTGVLEGGLSSR